jgi:hypothetical protein
MRDSFAVTGHPGCPMVVVAAVFARLVAGPLVAYGVAARWRRGFWSHDRRVCRRRRGRWCRCPRCRRRNQRPLWPRFRSNRVQAGRPHIREIGSATSGAVCAGSSPAEAGYFSGVSSGSRSGPSMKPPTDTGIIRMIFLIGFAPTGSGRLGGRGSAVGEIAVPVAEGPGREP